MNKKDIIKNLRNGASEMLPDRKWQETTLSRLSVLKDQEYINKSNNLALESHSLLRFFTNKRFLFLVTSVIVIVLVGSTSGTYLFINNTGIKKGEEVLISDIEKKEIFEKVVANNTEATIAQVSPEKIIQEPQTDPVTDFSKTTTTEEPKINTEEDNFKITKTATTFGTVECVELKNLYSEGLKESYEYLQDKTWISKQVKKDNDGKLIEYVYKNNSDENNKIFYYKGGDYALTYEKETNLTETPDAQNNNNEENSEEDSLFTNDSKFVDKQTLDDPEFGTQEFYVFEQETEFNCEPEVEGNQNAEIVRNKLFLRSWINSETFEINKIEIYLNSVTQDNLVVKIESKSESQKIEDPRNNDLLKNDFENVEMLDLSATQNLNESLTKALSDEKFDPSQRRSVEESETKEPVTNENNNNSETTSLSKP